ncbi:MAG: hypothetical protein IPI93_06055 [Sphingobacteriaceae bacterium]|nr:hypothetical protein [Sphingobacteriaceae bacterium]MBK7816323.1 hypothetical protein [Sphingobacteriaceae bacterium]
MKNHFIKLVLLASTIIVLTNCNKLGKDFDNYFYTDIENSAGPLTLFIDGKNKGGLPYLKTSVSPTNDTIINHALHLTLKSGKYKIEAKDNQGNLKCSFTLKFRSNLLSTSGTIGRQTTAASGKIVVTKLNY